jgi:LSD1 subclass zinc finger protein
VPPSAEKHDLELNEIICPGCGHMLTHPYAAASVICPSCTAELALPEDGAARVLRGPDASDATRSQLELERHQVALERLPESLAPAFDPLSLAEVSSVADTYERERARLAAEGAGFWRDAGHEQLRGFIGGPFALEGAALQRVAASAAVYHALVRVLVAELRGLGKQSATALTQALLSARDLQLTAAEMQATHELIEALFGVWTRSEQASRSYIPGLLAIPTGLAAFTFLRGGPPWWIAALATLLELGIFSYRRRSPHARAPVEALLFRLDLAQALRDPSLREAFTRELPAELRAAWANYIARVPAFSVATGCG